jgi:hypothetical protein
MCVSPDALAICTASFIFSWLVRISLPTLVSHAVLIGAIVVVFLFFAGPQQTDNSINIEMKYNL